MFQDCNHYQPYYDYSELKKINTQNIYYSNDLDEANNHSFLDEDNCEKINLNSLRIFSENFNVYKNQKQITNMYTTKEPPKFFDINDIMEIIKKYLKDDEEFTNKLKENNIFEGSSEYNKLVSKKRARNSSTDYLNYEIKKNEEEKMQKKNRGRAPKNQLEGIRIKHSKYFSDNIIKKIKDKFFNYGIIFLNKILGLKDPFKLKIIAYKIINKTNRNKDLHYLDMNLFDLFSLETSIKTKVIDHNKIILKKIKEKIKENNKILFEETKKKTINFALNMSFRDFIDLLIGKKKVKDFEIDEQGGNIIQSCIEGLGDILENIKEKNSKDEYYFKKFVFYMYNYERALYLKTPRKSKTEKT